MIHNILIFPAITLPILILAYAVIGAILDTIGAWKDKHNA